MFVGEWINFVTLELRLDLVCFLFQVSDDQTSMDGSMSNLPVPKGRWAQRVDTSAIVMKSVMDDNSSVNVLAGSLGWYFV